MTWPGIPFWNTATGGSGGGGGIVASSGDSGLPKYEGHIQVPLDGWRIRVVEVPSAIDEILIPTSRRFLNTASYGTTSLLAYIVAALNASSALAGTYGMVVDDDYDLSTGRVTMSASGLTSFSVTWLSTAARDALGFTAGLFGAASYTSPNSSPHIYLPDSARAPAMVPDGDEGMPLTNGTVLVSPSGKTRAKSSAERRVDRLEHACLRGQKVWADYETVVNESLETFWRNNIGKGRRIRYHKNRSNDAVFHNGYRVLAINDMRVAPELESANWTSSAKALWHWGSVECACERTP